MNIKHSEHTKILKKEIKGKTYLAVVWRRTNRVVSIYWQSDIGAIKIASFNEKNTKRLNAFRNLSMYFKDVA